MNDNSSAIEQAADILANAERACASTGAGMSAESRIDTFRDPGGLWDKISPTDVGTVEGLMNTLAGNADILKPIFRGILQSFEQADPNPGHIALAELERLGILDSVITQNVDNLHVEAGNKNVIEVHGNAFRMGCLSCGVRIERNRKKTAGEVRERLEALPDFSLEALVSLAPPCPACGGITRPDVVMFGEMVKDLPRAYEAVQRADVMMVLGTSGAVYPAAGFPAQAKSNGARVIVVNPTENPFGRIADVYIRMHSGEALPLVVARVKEILGE
ncbi:MAG: SIR2 family NAD-dependent protein deacylase [Desulfatibacillaceae bacterium]